ncbi:MAG: hypothetical protein A2107_01260 [Verrucomicrobia bacterium GWF2_62_7]|nr:MAG: hypothetical protein A2107_01260 [Verrucomicrobia bacterium GWF2_62_7]
MGFTRDDLPAVTEKLLSSWGNPRLPQLTPLWANKSKDIIALAVAPNAVVIAKPSELVAHDLQDGKVLWTQPLQAPPVPWGLAINRDGRVIVTLEGGQVACFGALKR